MKGILQPQILRVGRTHTTSVLSVIPDTPTHRAQVLLQTLLERYLHTPLAESSLPPPTAPSIVGWTQIGIAAYSQPVTWAKLLE